MVYIEPPLFQELEQLLIYTPLTGTTAAFNQIKCYIYTELFHVPV